MPQLGQNPSLRPGLPSRPRPTGSSHLLQKRRDSETLGSRMTAVAGSRSGTRGSSMSPAPSPPRDDPRLRLEPRVEPLPVTVGTEPGVVATLTGAADDAGLGCAGTAPAGARRPHSSQ
ncbi:hypothetical protein GCM10027575_02490 [Phytohabitans suffuscus]